MLAIIPARSGSKRIPGKNTKTFHGKPMIAWTIEAAKTSGLFDKIVVCSDIQPTLDIAKQYGVDGLYVSGYLSGDEAPIIEVVKYAAGNRRDVALLYACAPFMTGDILKEAYCEFRRGTGPLLAVSKIGGGLEDDAGMFCFYDEIKRENFRFFHVSGGLDINTPDDWDRADKLFNEMKGNSQ